LSIFGETTEKDKKKREAAPLSFFILGIQHAKSPVFFVVEIGTAAKIFTVSRKSVKIPGLLFDVLCAIL
jgi:hypothetical protein